MTEPTGNGAERRRTRRNTNSAEDEMGTRRMYGTLMMMILAAACQAGEPGSCVLIRGDTSGAPGPVNARLDFLRQWDTTVNAPGGTAATSPGRKSGWLAAGISLALPGTGELYSGDYLKSAIFLAVEATLWAYAYHYEQMGNRQTNSFQNFANIHWDVVKYAQYAQDHYNPPNGPYNWLIPGTAGEPPWVRVNWQELNRMEADIGATAAGSYYSHQLPSYNTQSYYELIGKYPQYDEGWDDSAPTFNYGDHLSNEFLYYSGQRGLANIYYLRSSLFVGIAVVNHVVSAIDAALTAGSYNRGLHASVGAQSIPTDRGMVTVPSLCLRYGL